MFCLNFFNRPTPIANAAEGINRQINFQGKLVNPNGTNVTDGSYTIVFSVYTVSSGGTAIWTETQTPTVTQGIFQVSLGSVTALPGSIDFNTDNIFLGIKVGADAEMTPRIRFTAVPQAFNSEKLGGLDKTGFIQNTTTQQADSNFNISGSGVVGTSLTTPLLQSAASSALTITGNAASTWSTTAGNITIQAGSGTISLGTTTNLTAGGALTINATGGALTLQTTTSGNIIVNGAGILDVQDNATFAGTVGITGNLTVDTNTFFVDAASNRVGVGTVTPAAPLDVTGTAQNIFNGAVTQILGTLTSTNNNQAGLRVNPTIAPSAAVSGSPLFTALTMTTESSSANLGSAGLAGIYGGTYYSGTGTVASSYGAYLQNQIVAAGTLTNSHGLYVDNPVRSAGTITNNYGIYIKGQTQGSTNYAFYSEGGANFFGGSLQFASLNCTTFTNGGSLTTDASGNVSCSNDDGGGASSLQGAYDGSGTPATINQIHGKGIVINGAQPASQALANGTNATTVLTVTGGQGGNSSLIGATAGNGGALTFTSGAGGNSTGGGGSVGGNGGTITIQTGAGGTGATNGSYGALNLQNSGGSTTIGNTTTNSSVTLRAGTGGISIGNSGIANTVQIGNTTGAVAQTINLGNNATASSSTTVTIGSTIGTSPTAIRSGTGDLNLSSTDQIILNAGSTIELQDNTNIGGNVVATGTGSFAGASVSIGAAALQGSLILNDGNGGQTATIQIGNIAANTVLTMPGTLGSSDIFCFVNLANCADGGVLTVGTFSTTNTAANGATITGTQIIFQAASASAPGMVSTGSQTFAGNKTFNGSVVLAASQTLTLTGNTTANRPASPTEGMLFYDTTTDRLLTYTGGKWQATGGEYTIVAANNSPQAIKDAADYVADGTGDQTEINAALTAASGGKVYLAQGTYVANATILIPNNTTLAGAGRGTLIELADIDVTDNLIENTDVTTGTGITIRDLRLNGRNDLNTAGTQVGIYLTEMGDFAASRKGAVISSVEVTNFRSFGIRLQVSDNNTINASNVSSNGNSGIYLNGSSRNVVSANNAGGNTEVGILVYNGSNNNSVTGNVTIGNSLDGIFIWQTSNGNTVTGNTAASNTQSGLRIYGAENNTISGNVSRTNTTRGISLEEGANNNTVTGNTTEGNLTFGIALVNNTNNNVVTGNKVTNNGDSTANNGIYLQTSDNNTITGNAVSDSSATTTNYAIYIFDSTSDSNYLAGNNLGGGSINDVGTGTIYGGQVNNLGDFVIQPAGSIALNKNTTITGVLTMGTTTQAGSLVIHDGNGGHTATIQLGNIAANTVLSLPASLGTSDIFCFQTLANCGSGGSGVTTVGTYSTTNTAANGATISGSQIIFQSASASAPGMVDTGSQTFAGNKTFNGSVVLAASQTLTITGNTTANRPGSPTEGMLFFDTTTKQLITYSNGKWQATNGEYTIVAASDSTQAIKDAAHYVADGNTGAAADGDQVQINAALTAAAGGKVYLAPGTYVADATILIPNNTMLTGAGRGTVIQLSVGSATDNLIENSDTTTGDKIIIQDLTLNGSLGTGGVQHAIYLNGLAGTTNASRISGLLIESWANGDAILLANGSDLLNLSNNVIKSDVRTTLASNIWAITGNKIEGDLVVDGASSYLDDVTGNFINGTVTVSNNAALATLTGNSIYFISTLTSGDVGVISSNEVYETVSFNASYIGSFTNNVLYKATTIDGTILDTFTGNTVYETVSLLGSSFISTATGNTFYMNITAVSSSEIVVFSSNSVFAELSFSGTAMPMTISNNYFYLSGAEDGISLTNSDNVTISYNTFDSNGTTGYAINITDALTDSTQLAGNTLDGLTINDLGTNTVYNGQLTPTNQIQQTASAGVLVKTGSATAFQVQNTAGNEVLRVDTTTSNVHVGKASSITGKLVIHNSSNANTVTITTGVTTTSYNLVLPTSAGSAGQCLMNGATPGELTFGECAPAPGTKRIRLHAEYPNSVIQGSGTNNTGTMTSEVNYTDRMSYFKWTTAEATNQSYDVVVQVPIPNDFASWASTTPIKISTRTSNTTNGTITLELRDSGNTVICNFVSVTPSTANTWQETGSTCNMSTGTYTAGNYITLTVRMQSPTSGDVRIGNIYMDYTPN